MFSLPRGFHQAPLFRIGKLPFHAIGLIVLIEVIGAILFALSRSSISPYISIDYLTLPQIEIWRLFTYAPFSSIDPFWLIGMFFFFLFGSHLELSLGRKNFLNLIISTVLITGLIVAISAWLAPGSLRGRFIGSHIIHLSIFMTYCWSMGNLPSMAMGIPMKWIGAAFVAVGFLQYISLGQHALAIAVISSPAWSIYFVQRAAAGRPIGFGKRKRKKRSKRPPAKAKIRPRSRINTASSTEVDRILDKINTHGFQSLTAEEKKTLDQSSNK